MVYEICAAVLTISIVLLVFYLIAILKALRVSLLEVNRITAKLESRIDAIGSETTQLLQQTNKVAESVQSKLKAFDPLFYTINQVGESVQDAAQNFIHRKDELENSFTHLKEETEESFKHHPNFQSKTKRLDIINNLIEIAAAGIILWQQIKKRR